MTAITLSFQKQGTSFASALWLTGILPRVLVLSAILALIALDAIPAPILVACLVIDLSAFIWSLTRYNSAAMAYLRSTLRFWSVAGGYLFFFVAAIATVFVWWLSLKDFEKPRPVPRAFPTQMVAPIANGNRYKIDFTKDSTAIKFTGVIAPGAVVDFEKFVLKSNQVDTVVLDSTGGDIFEAREFAADIRKYGLKTRVEKECNSSCLLLFVAADERSLGPGAKIGTHRYGLDFAQLRTNLGLIREMRTDQQYLLERGLEVEFLEAFFNLEREATWYPTRAELIAAGILSQ